MSPTTILSSGLENSPLAYDIVLNRQVSRFSRPEHPLLTRLNDSASSTPLICFHPIEGSFGSYRKLIESLPKDVSAFGFKQLQVRSTKDALESMINQYADAAADCSRGKPCRLFGYSFGAFLAMKVAKELERRHQPIEYVAIVDWVPFEDGDYSTKQVVLTDYFVMLHRYLSPRLSMLTNYPEDELRVLMQDFAKYLLHMEELPTLANISRRYRQLGLTEPATRTAMIKPILQPLYDRLPLLRDSGLEVISTPLKVWRAADGLARHEKGWSEWTINTCREITLPGNHMTVMQRPTVQMLAKQLGEFHKPSPRKSCMGCRARTCTRKTIRVA